MIQSATNNRADSAGTHEYFYRLNDSLATTHSVAGSDTGVVHRVDTIPIQHQ